MFFEYFVHKNGDNFWIPGFHGLPVFVGLDFIIIEISVLKLISLPVLIGVSLIFNFEIFENRIHQDNRGQFELAADGFSTAESRSVR